MTVEPPVQIDQQWALIIAAVATVFTAVGGLVLAVSVLVPTLRASKVAVNKVDEVHKLVNSSHDALLQYQADLVGALRDAEVDVPVDQSHRPADTPSSGSGAALLGLPDAPSPEQKGTG